MVRLREHGYSLGKIGKLYGISRQRVHQIISGYQDNLNSLAGRSAGYKETHTIAMERDYFSCQTCGSLKSLVVHHKDNDDRNNSLPNLITLCRPCHAKLHR